VLFAAAELELLTGWRNHRSYLSPSAANGCLLDRDGWEAA